MRIHMFPSGTKAGHYHYTAQLSNSLVNFDLIRELSVVGTIRNKSELKLLNPKIKVISLGRRYPSFLKTLIFFFLDQFKFLLHTIKNRPDIAHFQTSTISLYYTLLLIMFYKVLGIKIIRTVHEMTEVRLRKISWMEYRISILLLKLSDEIIVHNHYMKEKLLNIMGSERIHVIPHGNYLFFRKYTRDNKKGLSTKKLKKILFFGIKRYKGLEYFYKAIDELNRERSDFEVLLAGHVNPQEEKLIDKFRKIENVSVVAEYIPISNIWKYFTTSDFVVMPHIDGETSGAVHLAYSFKKPVIASDLPCFREVVRDKETGILVPRKNVRELKKAINFMLDHKELTKKMGEKGFSLENSKKYNWDVIAKQNIEVYKMGMGNYS